MTYRRVAFAAFLCLGAGDRAGTKYSIPAPTFRRPLLDGLCVAKLARGARFCADVRHRGCGGGMASGCARRGANRTAWPKHRRGIREEYGARPPSRCNGLRATLRRCAHRGALRSHPDTHTRQPPLPVHDPGACDPCKVDAVGQNRCGLTGDLFRLRFRCKVRIIHKVVSYLCKEPAVNTQCSFMDLVVMSQVTDWAIGRAFSSGTVEHCYPPQWDCIKGSACVALDTRFIVVTRYRHPW
jgi:hypothetical protein